MKEITIDGSKFDNIEGFYIEVDRVLTKDLEWQTGHNLNAFNDLLYGGFGVHEYGEPITIIWKNTSKSKVDLGHDSTNTEREKGDSIFDIIIEIIKEHDDIKLILK